jgi:hypothetical protein
MMRLLMIPALLLTFPLTASRDTEVPGATPAGKPVSCLRLTSIRNTRIHSDQVMDFHVAGGKVYRNTLPHSCPGLGSEERYLHKSSTGEICSVDTITVLYSTGGMQGATCGLGKFQPVTLEKRK